MSISTKKNYFFAGIVFLLFFLFITAFMIIAGEIRVNALRQFDYSVIFLVQSRISPFLTGVMELFTFLGSVKWIGMVVIVSSVWLFFKQKWSLGWFIILSSGAGSLFNVILKNIFKRQRPDIHRLISENGYSFPSGHSMGSFIFYGALAYIIIHYTYKKGVKTVTVIMMGLLVFFIGLSRVYLGVHYPSDIIGGYTAGGAWLTICVVIFRYYEYRKRL